MGLLAKARSFFGEEVAEAWAGRMRILVYFGLLKRGFGSQIQKGASKTSKTGEAVNLAFFSVEK